MGSVAWSLRRVGTSSMTALELKPDAPIEDVDFLLLTFEEWKDGFGVFKDVFSEVGLRRTAFQLPFSYVPNQSAMPKSRHKEPHISIYSHSATPTP